MNPSPAFQTSCGPVFFRVTIFVVVLSFATISGPLYVKFSSQYLGDNYQTSLWEHQLNTTLKRNQTTMILKSRYSQLGAAAAVNGLQLRDGHKNIHFNAHLVRSFPNYHVLDAAWLFAMDWSYDGLATAHGTLLSYTAAFTNNVIRKITTAGSYRWGFLDEGPLSRSLHIGSKRFGGSIALASKKGEIKAQATITQVEPVSFSHYRHALADSAFFYNYVHIINPFIAATDIQMDPFAANTLQEYSLYFFTEVRHWLYLGWYGGYQTSSHNFFVPLTQDTLAPDYRVAMDYLPYKTPVDRLYSGLSIVTVINWAENKNSVKLDCKLPLDIPGTVFPLTSRQSYRGYTQPQGGNLFNGFMATSEQYSAREALEITTTYTRKLPHRHLLQLSYTWHSEPYIQNRYFNTDLSYQYHTIRVTLDLVATER